MQERKELGRKKEKERVNWLCQNSREEEENTKIQTYLSWHIDTCLREVKRK